MSDHRTIQAWLNKQDKNPANEPIYRLVWADDQIETRRGIFREFYGNIFLRETSGFQQVRKYSYLKGRWILEKWLPPELVFTPDIPESHNGSYEPLFPFEDKNGNPLPLSLRVVELIVSFDRADRKSWMARRDEIRADMDSREAKEYAELLDSIDTTDVQSLLHSREAIVNLYGKEKFGGKKN